MVINPVNLLPSPVVVLVQFAGLATNPFPAGETSTLDASADGLSDFGAQNAWPLAVNSSNDNFLIKSTGAKIRLVRAGRYHLHYFTELFVVIFSCLGTTVFVRL